MKFVVLDLETTGLSPYEDEIIEIALVLIDPQTFQEIDRFHSFVRPQKEIPELITQITNISLSEVENAPWFPMIAERVQNFLSDNILVGHNINFDISFLESHGISCRKNPKLDTFFLANFLCYEEHSLNLGYLSQRFGISLENAHRAIDDTLATGKLLQALIEKLTQLPHSERRIVQSILQYSQDPWVQFVSKNYLKEDEILEIAKLFEQYMLHFIPENSETKETKTKRKKIVFDDVFSRNGLEKRENQNKMLDIVDKALKNGEQCMIEAPTGVGKTFAYLLPAISFSQEFGERVYISTSTKALQDQIYYKDAQALKENFWIDFTFTKIKGKRNYFSQSAFQEFCDVYLPEGQTEILGFILKLFLWSKKTDLWELDEINFYGAEYQYISEITAANLSWKDTKNQQYEFEFLMRARKRVQESDIVICNTHILLQDIAWEAWTLWEVKNLIMDEAHNLEDVVTSALRKTLSYQKIEMFLSKCEKYILTKKIEFPDFSYHKQKILFAASELFSLLDSYILEKVARNQKYQSLLLKEDFFLSEAETILSAEKLRELFEDLLQDIASHPQNALTRFQQEIEYFTWTLGEVFSQKDTKKYIYYLQFQDQTGLELYSTILEASSFLEQTLWSGLESVILTSATLQLWESFQYLQSLLGLERANCIALESDFDYKQQALVFIPQDLWSIKYNNERILAFLRNFFLIVRGNTLVLFTSFAMIRDCFGQMKLDLEAQGIHLLAQSISGSKHKQIQSFKEHASSSILLWTDTFWEGVDIPGDDLQYLLIHKIPFQVPSDPIFQGRSQLFQDAFRQYAIPKAILKLKQWFGRLIRSASDNGVIVFLDDRIYSQKWGEEFYKAFPKGIKIKYGSSENFLEIMKKTI